MKNKMNKKLGFTLIELLVVIAIIGLLASVVLASLSSARERAAWSKFDQEILQIKTATQLYREKNNGEWPASSDVTFNSPGALLETLNSSGLYSGDLSETPDGHRLASFDNIETGGGYIMSCDKWVDGGDAFVFYISDDGETKSNSNVFGDLYVNGDLQASYSCSSLK
ncbi:type II secretion system protein [Candidatus Parcubacteria bacterium]|nr:type II secretion system protein [Candidatus Parcubacteria bacterium]